MLLTILILLFTVLMIGAIWLSRLAAQRHRTEIEQKQRARSIKHRLNEITNVSMALLEYDGNKSLLEAITEFRIDQIQKRLEILDDNDSEGELEAARAFRDSLEEMLSSRKPGLPSTDSAINDMKKNLFKGIKAIKLMQTQGYLMDSEVAEHLSRLRIIMLKTEVNAYIQQGRALLNDEDRVNAASHFKHAKELLVASDLRFPERTSMIKRISKMIWGIYSTQEDDHELDIELGLTEREKDDMAEEAGSINEQSAQENADALDSEMEQRTPEGSSNQ